MDYVSAAPLGREQHAAGDDLRLIQRACNDTAAFNELYRAYVDRVYRYMRSRLPTPEDAADLTQQVFLQAFDALPKYRDRGLPFAAWLFRIAHNIVADSYRRKRIDIAWDALPEALRSSSAGNPEAEFLRQEALGRLRMLVAQLDPDKRELLALRFAGGLSSREIAEVVGKREAAVKKQLTRIVQMLKEQYHAS
jgi:RNA polymerase sigma-70 factor, ECF subfamily